MSIAQFFNFSAKCEDLVGPSNGSIVLATNGLVTIATVLCDVGGSLKGTRELTCSDTGIWDFPAPSCGKAAV